MVSLRMFEGFYKAYRLIVLDVTGSGVSVPGSGINCSAVGFTDDLGLMATIGCEGFLGIGARGFSVLE